MYLLFFSKDILNPILKCKLNTHGNKLVCQQSQYEQTNYIANSILRIQDKIQYNTI